MYNPKHNICIRSLLRHTIRCAARSVVLLATGILMASCSNQDSTGFRSSAEALQSYDAFLTELSAEQPSTGSDFVALCKRWHTERDSVISAINRDTEADNARCMEQCIADNDSVCRVLGHLTEGVPLTFSDYFDVRRLLCDVTIRQDEQPLIDRYTQFFASLDKERIKVVGKTSLLQSYNAMLQRTATCGFRGKGDVLRFLREEDVMFRSFLTHLAALGDHSLTDIRRNTETVCGNIFYAVSAGEGADTLTRAEVVVLMTMRSNRRLLQNAETCLNDVRQGKVRGDNQRAAYLWMLLQPVVSLDDFSLSMLTDGQRQQLSRLAAELPDVASMLQGQSHDLPFELSELPALLTKAYILGKN